MEERRRSGSAPHNDCRRTVLAGAYRIGGQIPLPQRLDGVRRHRRRVLPLLAEGGAIDVHPPNGSGARGHGGRCAIGRGARALAVVGRRGAVPRFPVRPPEGGRRNPEARGHRGQRRRPSTAGCALEGASAYRGRVPRMGDAALAARSHRLRGDGGSGSTGIAEQPGLGALSPAGRRRPGSSVDARRRRCPPDRPRRPRDPAPVQRSPVGGNPGEAVG